MDGINVLIITAITLGFMHTVIGPDHYLPFIVMSKARNWTMKKTLFITVLCGFGHILSSVVIGLIGIAAGIAISKIEMFEGHRGNIAAWAFIIFGFVYMIWGIYRAVKNKRHTHLHFHKGGSTHEHEHTHEHDHSHVHDQNITPWILFTIFLLGPCEPLIPLLMYPAANNSVFGTVAVTSAFGITTISTMTLIVFLSSYGIKLIKTDKLEKYMHAIAGFTIFASGMAIQFLGL
jgi:nickel/cobalt transporter (NicO) family protein